MDRRTFLKTLSALVGSALSLPADLASASDADIDAAFQQASDWLLFEVGPTGTLSDARFDPPSSRRDAYGLYFAARLDVSDIEGVPSLQREVESLCAGWPDAHPALAGTPAWEAARAGDWQTWLDELDADERADIDAAVDAWLSEPPDMNFEWDELHEEATAEGQAYVYFRDDADPDMMDALNITVIEGDCPGSTYYAAELGMDVDRANRLAETNGWPLRFVWEASLLQRRG